MTKITDRDREMIDNAENLAEEDFSHAELPSDSGHWWSIRLALYMRRALQAVAAAREGGRQEGASEAHRLWLSGALPAETAETDPRNAEIAELLGTTEEAITRAYGEDWPPKTDARDELLIRDRRMKTPDAWSNKDIDCLLRRIAAAREEVRQEAAEEIKELRRDVIAFCAPWAAIYAHDHGLPDGHLHPVHYDILARCGARMDAFSRAETGKGK